MKVFLTGGTGLLGYNLARELIARRHTLKALVRRPEAVQLLGPEVQVIQGDLRDPRTYENQLAHSDVLIHAAAVYGEFYRTGKQGLPGETNVEGSLGLLEAAWRQGIRNVIYLSSAAVLKPNEKGRADETCPYASFPDDPYFQSKVDAEKAVLRFAKAHPDLRLILILPAAMLGPGDIGPTPTGAFLLNLLRRKLAFVLPGWHRLVDARDVARASVEAITKGSSGERFLIGGRRYPVAEVYQALTQASGVPTPTRPISPAKLLLLSRLMVLASRVTRRAPAIRPNLVKRLLEDFWYCSDKAEQKLGVCPRPLSETMADTVQWFRSVNSDLVLP